MKITLHSGETYEVELPETSHTYEEILSELKEKYLYGYEYLIWIIKYIPQVKQIVPYFYDFVFSTNYKEAEKNFIKGILNFPDSFEAQKALFPIVDITGGIAIPHIIGKEYHQGLIFAICEIIGNINEFGSGYNNCGLMSWKQIRIVLLDCQKSENPLETWKKRIPEVEYFSDKIDKLYDKYPELGDRVLYDKIDELENF